ncbi:MAG: S-layer homology domain-containing protein, partial [Propionibacteriaceae bacterium]|nr:S-layer homology domain-containing protein [Propionibacteriaceae bacterium]
VANSYTITTADAGALLRVIAKVSYPGLAAVTKEYKVGIPLAEGQYFVDILTTHVLAERIGWLFEEGITLGYQTQYGAEYRPNNSVTRAEMATFMYRLAGSPAFSAPVKSPFTDVSPSAGSYKAVAWLVDKKISSGYQGASGAEYRPNNSVTRAEMATFLYRLAGSPAFNAPQKSSFADVSVGAGYFKAMEWLVAQGVTSGYQGASGAEYRPNNSVTRGEMATFLWRMDSKELVTSAS